MNEAILIKAVSQVAKEAELHLPQKSYWECANFSTAVVTLAKELGLDAELYSVPMRFERGIGEVKKGDIENHTYFRLGSNYYDFTLSQFGGADNKVYAVRTSPYPNSKKNPKEADSDGYTFWYDKIKNKMGSTDSWRTLIASKYQIVATDVWYHGRSVDSDKFDLAYVGKEEAKDQEGPGFYFTTDKEDATQYAHPSGIVLTVQLTPRKLVSNSSPAPIDHVKYLIDHAPDKETTLTNWDENPVRARKLALDAMLASGNAKDTFESVWFDFYRDEPKRYLETLIHLGYDGHRASKTEKHIIIYNPKVIKILNKEQY